MYLVTNLVTGKSYVGKTGQKVIDRWTRHKGDARKDEIRTYFHRALRKYGADSFDFRVLAEFGTEGQATNAERLWIITLNTHHKDHGYNLTLGGEGCIPNEETRAKMSKAQKGRPRSEETKRKMSEIMQGRGVGRKISEETRKKKSEASSGTNNPFFGKTHSDETKKKISEAKKGTVTNDEHRQKLSIAGRARYAKLRAEALNSI